MSKITVTTIAGQTSGADANKVKIESGDTLEVVTNATVGGTLGVTGDLTVDTDTLFVDASADKVGIGTATPSNVLHVKGAASTDGILIQNPLSGSLYNAKVEFSRDGESGGAKIQTERNASTGGVGLSFSTTADNSAEGSGTYTQRMKIDEAGNVTMPSQPVFHVTRTSAQSTSTSTATSTPLEFPTSTAIVSSTHFNHTTHRFTAPVAGKYMFQWGYGTNSPAGQSQYRTFIWKNGAKLAYTQLRNDSTGMTGYNYGSRSAIVSLAASDYVHLNSSCDAGHAFYGDSELRIFFQGYLLA